MYHGDIRLGETIDIKFTSRRFTTGAPFTLAGSPVISAYPDNSTTQLTAGITLSVDFDSVTGLNNVRVVASGGNGYAAGNYALVITTGTVDSVSVVGEVIGSFSIDKRSAPTAIENADALLNRDMSTGTDSGSTTVRTVRQALRALRNKWALSGSTKTVYKEDDSTSSWTSTVSTDAGGVPIVGDDPAGP